MHFFISLADPGAIEEGIFGIFPLFTSNGEYFNCSPVKMKQSKTPNE